MTLLKCTGLISIAAQIGQESANYMDDGSTDSCQNCTFQCLIPVGDLSENTIGGVMNRLVPALLFFVFFFFFNLQRALD